MSTIASDKLMRLFVALLESGVKPALLREQLERAIKIYPMLDVESDIRITIGDEQIFPPDFPHP